MAAASVSPPGSLDLLQPGFSKALLGTRLEDKYLCSACKNVLRRPFQAQCGHRYCSHCLTSILSAGPQNCAACVHEGIYEEGISILESSSAFPDNAARREVESLPAVCPSDGCTWKGTLKEYESCHEGHCPFLLTECPACKGLVRLGDREHHVEHECPERSLSCRHCQAPCCWADMKAHHDVCPKFPLTCDGCGKKKIPREKFQDHVRTCGKCQLPCRFHTVGCLEMLKEEARAEHEVQRLREHLALLLNGLLETRLLSGDGVRELGDCDAHTPGPASESPKTTELLRRCEELERKTATFENIVCVLNREVERVAMTSEACGRQHRLDQDRIEALSNKVQQLERSIGLKDLAMADLEQKVQDMEASTYDGVFIWKISDFARKRQEAVAGRTPAIFSPAFYTSRYGYKMCLRIYLNGDGTGRGTHLSLFFVVMKGPHDALLRWPFNQKVTLMLLDQNNREHVIDAFRPDVTSSSFQRPVTEMNIASGCPLFCPVSKLEAKNSYVRDDAIFIKAIVDLTGL
ncbi:TNF receptor-associated factor 2 isoform X1 [Erinaceus europaeus]|uniref:TNF receptor-associated factor n=1 Tax=Erinaceus europaeus TaxID=9365 RepID=A0A1S3W9D9_ERIEU|nr:TNF receptor-associated factor 2 isoform X1 [Erinaceus europaeus]XP_016042933.1 TNF receptor-associated factor 2 isoform X1 [Erinaceus europaeus]XP_060055388.1 TNF receptor-associated factor 2 isoform X1 [Erinaceus europaeus]XP_060055389.1 TNF receptor-associated factor 2 isoform X1 [Erinaceus europaeus]